MMTETIIIILETPTFAADPSGLARQNSGDCIQTPTPDTLRITMNQGKLGREFSSCYGMFIYVVLRRSYTCRVSYTDLVLHSWSCAIVPRCCNRAKFGCAPNYS